MFKTPVVKHVQKGVRKQTNKKNQEKIKKVGVYCLSACVCVLLVDSLVYFFAVVAGSFEGATEACKKRNVTLNALLRTKAN